MNKGMYLLYKKLIYFEAVRKIRNLPEIFKRQENILKCPCALDIDWKSLYFFINLIFIYK